MLAQEPPIYIVSLGRVYRRDTVDATHTPIFHQVEALVSAHIRSPTCAGRSRRERLRLRRDPARAHADGLLPFTEPSVEFDVTCYMCDGSGCAVCKRSGWVEMGGAGEVDPNVLEGDCDRKWQGFAFGLGIDRIAAARHCVPDCACTGKRHPLPVQF